MALILVKDNGSIHLLNVAAKGANWIGTWGENMVATQLTPRA